MKAYDDADLARRLGVYVQPGIGEAYPELAAQVRRIMVEKVSKIPFLPAGWLDEVLAIIDTNPPTLVKIYPVFKSDGVTTNELAPTFATYSPEAAKVWQELSEVTRLAQFNYAAGKVEEGRAVMDAAYARAAFWDTAYNVAVWIRDAPGNAVNAVATGTMSFAWSFIKRTWWVWALLAVGALVWFNRGALARAAGRKGMSLGERLARRAGAKSYNDYSKPASDPA